MDYRDLFYRFLFGGIAVVLSYVTSIVLPWEMIGGIFAAFPAVMIVAVMMVGIKKAQRKQQNRARFGFRNDRLSRLCCDSFTYFTSNKNLVVKHHRRLNCLVY